MTITDTGWQARAARLADQLEADGVLHDPAWAAAVREVPRHVFVPEVYKQDLHTFAWQSVDVTSPEGLDRVYSSETLVTTLADKGTHQEAISSSTKPDLMIRMLEALDIRAGHRVLEIGTGTGYNAALLCARLGDPRVFSVDIDSALVDRASERLARTGFHPTLAAVDGVGGLPEHAPMTGSSPPAQCPPCRGRGSNRSSKAGSCWSTSRSA